MPATPPFNTNEPAATVQDFVNLPLSLISVNGFQLLKWTTDEPPNRRIQIMLRICLFLMTYNFVSMMFFFIFDQLDTALDYTTQVMYWAFAYNAVWKGRTLWVGRHKIEFILKGLMARHPRTPQERKDFRVVEYYKKIHAYNKFLIVWHLATTTLVNLHPLATSLLKYVRREDKAEAFDYVYPFAMWYFYDDKTPFFFFLSYLIQFMGAYYTSILYLGGDTVLISLVHLVNMHFDYLGRQIEQLQPGGSDVDMKKLGPLLEYHQEILDYAEVVDSIFSLAILINYLGSCLVLCLIGIQCVVGSDFVGLIKFVAFLISMMVHVYLISYFGNNLIDLSVGISDAFYNHTWYKGNYKYMRMLVLPIARSQRYAHLTAFSFFEISMDSFKSLCTTSYQFFTLIRTSLSEENAI